MRRQIQSKSREKQSIRADRNGVYEQTETEYRADRNGVYSREKQNQEARGEISRCIEYTGWLYIAEKEQTSRDFHKKNVGGTGRKVVY